MSYNYITICLSIYYKPLFDLIILIVDFQEIENLHNISSKLLDLNGGGHTPFWTIYDHYQGIFNHVSLIYLL